MFATDVSVAVEKADVEADGVDEWRFDDEEFL